MYSPRDVLQTFIRQALTTEEITDSVFSYFPSVYPEFTEGQTQSQRIRLLVEYIDKHQELDKLIEVIRTQNPKVFAEFETKIAKIRFISTKPKTQYQPTNEIESVNHQQNRINTKEEKIYWGDAPDVSNANFHGRKKELQTLKKWIIKDRCRLVAILGMAGIGKTKFVVKLGKGGIGKTDLSVKFARDIQSEFEYVIWRSLVNKPKFTDILTDLIKHLSNQQEFNLPDTLDNQISRLLHYLKQYRCLLILDNVETILQKGDCAGEYAKGFEEYGQLFKKIAEVEHQSCLIITSREKLKNLETSEGKTKRTRFLQLPGLDWREGQKIFLSIEDDTVFTGSNEEWKTLIEFYNGNPLVLELVARYIKDVHFGKISTFLQQGQFIFGESLTDKNQDERDDLRKLLDWHFNRLSDREKEIMYWLAINREPVSNLELTEDLLSAESKQQVGTTLQSLQRRIPLEKSAEKRSLQPVLIEYMTYRLVEEVCQEIRTGEISIFKSHAFLKAQAADYVRESQIRLILKPIEESLRDDDLEARLNHILKNLPKKLSRSRPSRSYAAGNILNLFCHTKLDLQSLNRDFSGLAVWQAYLQNIDLQDVNFAYSDLSKSIFTHSFGIITSIAFSRDGKSLATGTGNGDKILFWNLVDGKLNLDFTLPKDNHWVQTIAFGSDGNLFASGGDNNTIEIWDLRTEKPKKLNSLKGHEHSIRALAFSPNGKILASSSADKEIKLWDWTLNSEDKCLKTFKKHSDQVETIAFINEGKILVSGSFDGTIKLWDVETGEDFCTFPHPSSILAFAIDREESILASASSDGIIQLWNLKTEKEIDAFPKQPRPILSITFSPNGETLAIGSEDGTIQLWNIETKELLYSLSGHKQRWVLAIGFSPDGNTLLSGSGDESIRVWDVNTGQCLHAFQGWNNWLISITFSPDGKTLVTSGTDRTIRFWDVDTWDVDTCQYFDVKKEHEHKDWVDSVAFSPDGEFLASGSSDLTICLWNAKTGEWLNTFSNGHETPIRKIVFSPDRKTIASCSDDRTIRIWDVETGNCLKIFSGHEDRVNSVAFSPDGKMVASCSNDRTIRIWNVEKENCLKILSGHTNLVYSVVFSLDGKILASGSEDRTIRIWNVETGKCLHAYSEHTKPVKVVAFSLDGKFLATGSNDGTIGLWKFDKKNNTLNDFYPFKGHTNPISSLVFSPNPDGLFLASIADVTIIIWDVQKREDKCQKTWVKPRPYEKTNITGATFSQDSKQNESQKNSLKALGAVESIEPQYLQE